MKLLLALILLPVLLLLILIEQMPADTLLRQQLPTSIKVQDIEGTLISGQLHEIEINNLPWSLQTLSWQMSPLSLLTLKPESSVTAHSWNHAGNSSLHSQVLYDPGANALTLSDLTAQLQLAQLAVPMELPITGTVELAIDKLTLISTGCTRLSGHITLTNIHAGDSSHLTPLKPQLGTLSCQDGKISIKLPLQDPQIEASLEAQIGLQGDYLLRSAIRRLSPALQRQAGQILEKAPDGSYTLDYQGSFYW